MAQGKQQSLFEAEQADEESKEVADQQKASREMRSLDLIAEFENGFAKGWLFPLTVMFQEVSIHPSGLN